ncbi:MAG TPA: DUF4235 domain-containing protein [Streptosporangiaceae bacterium]|jgi:hypothetical protein
MAGKQSSSARAINALAGAAAAFGARKLITFGWKKLTGKEPPEHPEDPQVALREALVWGVVLGVTVSTARMLAMRATSRRTKEVGGPPV